MNGIKRGGALVAAAAILASSLVALPPAQAAEATAANWSKAQYDDPYEATYTRLGTEYTVAGKVGGGNVPDGSPTNVIIAPQSITGGGTAWHYLYFHGSGETSMLMLNDSTLTNVSDATFYKDGNKVRRTGLLTPTTQSSDSLRLDEQMQVTVNGDVRHDLTFTAVQPFSGRIAAKLDTMLNDDDNIPLYADGADGVYISSGEFTLSMDPITGIDNTYAGEWDTAKVNGTPAKGKRNGEKLMDKVDTSIFHQSPELTLAAGQSYTMSFQESVYAHSEHRVLFNANGGQFKDGTPSFNSFVIDSKPVDQPEKPTWANHTFKGWSTSQDGSSGLFDFSTTLTDNVTLYAQWDESNPFTIRFDANGGQGSMNDVQVKGGQTVTLPANAFTRAGYTFAGWQLPDGGTVADQAQVKDLASTADETIVLKAQWKAGQSTIRFDANGGQGSMNDVTGATDSKVTLPANAFTRDGWTFTGWNTKSDGTGDAIQNASQTTIPGGGLTLYAQWKALAGAVGYQGNAADVTGVTGATSGVTGQSVKAAANGFVRAGWTFTGWNTKSDGSGDTVQPGASVTIPAGGMTLYAQWKADGTKFCYDTDGDGKADKCVDVVTGQETTAPDKPSKEGYDFKEWVDQNGGKHQPGDKITIPAGGLQLTPTWTAHKYTVRFDANQGKGTMKDMAFTYDQAQTLIPNAFTRDGYTFAGWAYDGKSYNDGQEVRNLTADNNATVTLTAQWTANKASVRYHANGGEGTMPESEGKTDATMTVAENRFAKTGWTFTGWNTKADGSGDAYAAGKTLTLPATGIDLYAQWKADGTKFCYDTDGDGKADKCVDVVTGQETTAPDKPSKEGYTFVEWVDQNGGKHQPGDKITIPAGGLQLTPTWTANRYTVSFDANQGKGSMNPQQFTYDQAQRLTANAFSRDGYTFAGWTYDGKSYNDGQEVRNLTADPDGKVTLAAQWTADKATIRYHANGGEGTMPETDGATDQTVKAAANAFTRDGWTFTGWNTQADGTGDTVQPDASVTLTKNGLDLYAQWKADKVTVTIDPDGGTGKQPPITGVTGQEITLPDNKLTRPGYTFTGWDTGDGKPRQPGDKITLPAGKLTITPIWTPNRYTVKYAGNGGVGTMADQAFTYDQDQQLTAGTFTRDGYTFTGWSDNNGHSYNDRQSVRNLTDQQNGTVTLYAQWKAEGANVSFNANQGQGAMDDIQSTTGTKVTLPANAFTRDGWTFTGWNTKADGTGDKIDDKTTVTVPAKGLTLYAQWKAGKASVTFNPNGDGSTGTTTTIEGTTDGTFTAPDNGFTRPGYTFTGWNTAKDGSGTAINPGDTVTIPAGGMTLHAQWKAEGANVSFNANQGQGAMDDIQSTTGTKVTLPANAFTRDGWTFTGWNTKADGTGDKIDDKTTVTVPAKGLTLYAQWKAGKASVTFNPNGDGSTGTTTTIEGTTDGTFTAPDNGFTRPGYTFTGWNTAKDGSGTAINPGDTVTIPAGGLILYSQWRANPSILRLDENGGSGSMDPVMSFTDAAATVPANAFTRDGWTFTGWNTKADGSGQKYRPGMELTMPVDGLTLYAQWVEVPAPVREVAHLAQTGVAFPLLLLGLLPAGASGMMLSSRRNGRPRHRR